MVSWWPLDKAEFLFVSPTSMINPESIVKALSDKGEIDIEAIQKQEELIEQARKDLEAEDKKKLRKRDLVFEEDESEITV